MAKARSRWVCQECGTVQIQHYGRCPACDKFNTLVEERIEPAPSGGGSRLGGRGGFAGGALPSGSARDFAVLRDVSPEHTQRTTSGISELDRVLGGGIVPGSVVLVGGEPGIGKSTLLGQLANNIGRDGRKVAYISGEESLTQIKLRADRLGGAPEGLLVLSETNLEDIVASLDRLKPDLAIIDSIQTVTSEELSGAAGSVGQVKESAQLLTRLAKASRIPIFIVSHVTKEGAIAGPKVLEHMVDTVLYLEGDRFHAYRMLRAMKNRFGSADEVGVFAMEEGGMREITNPSEVFLSEQSLGAPGSVVAATLEGSRPLLVEVQALTAETMASFPRRTVSGMDLNRVNVICATMAKRLNLDVYRQDVYVNLTGGLRTDDPAVDLAAALAIASAFTQKALPEKTVIIGEVGLTGEIRKVTHIEARIKEAARLGFTDIVTPQTNTKAPPGVRIHAFGTLSEAVVHFKLASSKTRSDKLTNS